MRRGSLSRPARLGACPNSISTAHSQSQPSEPATPARSFAATLIPKPETLNPQPSTLIGCLRQGMWQHPTLIAAMLCSMQPSCHALGFCCNACNARGNIQKHPTSKSQKPHGCNPCHSIQPSSLIHVARPPSRFRFRAARPGNTAEHVAGHQDPRPEPKDPSPKATRSKHPRSETRHPKIHSLDPQP